MSCFYSVIDIAAPRRATAPLSSFMCPFLSLEWHYWGSETPGLRGGTDPLSFPMPDRLGTGTWTLDSGLWTGAGGYRLTMKDRRSAPAGGAGERERGWGVRRRESRDRRVLPANIFYRSQTFFDHISSWTEKLYVKEKQRQSDPQGNAVYTTAVLSKVKEDAKEPYKE